MQNNATQLVRITMAIAALGLLTGSHCDTAAPIPPTPAVYDPAFVALGSDDCQRCGRAANEYCEGQDELIADYNYSSDGATCIARCESGLVGNIRMGGSGRCGEYEINLRPNAVSSLPCPTDHFRGDAEFDGHGPQASIGVQLRSSGTRVLADINYEAVEFDTASGREFPGETAVRGGPWTAVLAEHGGFFDANIQIVSILSRSAQNLGLTLGGHGVQVMPLTGATRIMDEVRIMGDTMGTDIPNNPSSCPDETHIESLVFRPVRVQIGPRG